MIFLHFLSFASSIKGKNLAIITHSGCDVDAFASAAALYLALSKSAKSASILVPEHINLQAKELAKNLKIPYLIDHSDLSKFDAAIVVDTNSISMVGDFAPQLKSFKKPLLVIDHHDISNDAIAKGSDLILRKDAVSSSEIIYDLFKAGEIKITQEIATFIACGIITDSAGFLIADHETFGIMAEVMKISQKDYYQIISLFKIKENISEKIAKLKAAKRSHIYNSFDHLLVDAEVGAHESDAAVALIILGADVAFAGNEDRGNIQISSRVSNEFMKKYNFDVTRDVFRPLQEEFSGTFGGHPGAAGYKGSDVLLETALKKCIVLTHNFLIEKMKKTSPLKEYE